MSDKIHFPKNVNNFNQKQKTYVTPVSFFFSIMSCFKQSLVSVLGPFEHNRAAGIPIPQINTERYALNLITWKKGLVLTKDLGEILSLYGRTVEVRTTSHVHHVCSLYNGERHFILKDDVSSGMWHK